MNGGGAKTSSEERVVEPNEVVRALGQKETGVCDMTPTKCVSQRLLRGGSQCLSKSNETTSIFHRSSS